jgi:hypothetical protein
MSTRPKVRQLSEPATSGDATAGRVWSLKNGENTRRHLQVGYELSVEQRGTAMSQALRTSKVKHGFLDHKIDPAAETIIIGTFNPGSLCDISFFYSGARNRLWRLLPNAFGERDLRQASRDEKIEFCRRRAMISLT